MRKMVLAILLIVSAAGQAAGQTTGTPASEDPAVRQAAGDHYRRGRELYEAGQPEEALAELRVSYSLIPHWATINGMALCLEDLGRKDEALATYVQGLREGGADIPAEQRSQMEARVVGLRTELGLGHVGVISTPPGATVFLNGASIGTTPLDQDIAAGSYSLTVEIPGEGRAERPLVVRAGETRVLELELLPIEVAAVSSLRVESDPSGATVLVDGTRIGVTPLLTSGVGPGEHELRIEGSHGAYWEERVTVAEGTEVRVRAVLPAPGVHQGWFWGVATAAAVLGITGAATGGYGVSLHDDYGDPAKSVGDRLDARDLGETMFDVADGMFIAAGVAAVGALVLGLFTDFGGGPGEGEAVVDVGPLGEGAVDAR
ncbi:MAG: PEGA domain-containing protein [Deltaproteobacteria bacterium]|nr:PEGA domain-containing protein [Deltaproteobacteria bacterium]